MNLIFLNIQPVELTLQSSSWHVLWNTGSQVLHPPPSNQMWKSLDGKSRTLGKPLKLNWHRRNAFHTVDKKIELEFCPVFILTVVCSANFNQLKAGFTHWTKRPWFPIFYKGGNPCCEIFFVYVTVHKECFFFSFAHLCDTVLPDLLVYEEVIRKFSNLLEKWKI